MKHASFLEFLVLGDFQSQSNPNKSTQKTPRSYLFNGAAGSRCEISYAAARISSCISPFVASTIGPPNVYGWPEKSLTFPPASSTNKTPAAVSHGFNPNSQNPSNRPAATLAKSSAADPSRRTPCDRSVKSQ